MKQTLGQYKQMIGMLRKAGNPEAMMQTMIQQNPKMRDAMEYIKENGGDPRTAFYKYAENQGVDPDEILSIFQ